MPAPVLTALRLLVASATAAFTLAAPVCPLQAQDAHECCCVHDDAQAPPHQTIQTPPCGCAEPNRSAHHEYHPASGATAAGVQIPAAAPAPRIAIAVAPVSVPQLAPPRARPPPQLIHLETVVLRR